MGIRSTSVQVMAALNPALEGRLAEFRAAVDEFGAVPQRARTIAVVGLTPGAGRSTAAALLALTVAGYSDRRVVVVDTVTPSVGPLGPTGRTGPGSVSRRAPSRADPAARTVTALLGGDVAHGRLDTLLGSPAGAGRSGAPGGVLTVPSASASAIEPVPRRRLRSAFTPHAVVPVLSAPPRRDGFPPQFLEQTLSRLEYRADLVVIDTPAGPRAPVLHAVVEQADHLVIVVSGTDDAAAQVRNTRDWLAGAPGRGRDVGSTVLVVARGLTAPRLPSTGTAPLVLARDEGLRRRRPDRLSRRSVVSGLRLATAVLR